LNDEDQFGLYKPRLTKMRSKTPEDAIIEMKLANTKSASPIDSPWVRHTKVNGDECAKLSSSGEQTYPAVRALDCGIISMYCVYMNVANK